jgi:hypothetical protein
VVIQKSFHATQSACRRVELSPWQYCCVVQMVLPAPAHNSAGRFSKT